MAEEYVDIFDENYNKIGKALKSEARENGNWIQSFHCWIVRPDDGGYVLFQKRGKDKNVFPNALDISAAGHYKSGEQIKDGVREIYEEIGMKVKFHDLIPLGVKFDIGKVKENYIREFCHTFFWVSELEPHQYYLASDEVEGLVEISINEGLKLFANEVNQIRAKGVEYNHITQAYEAVELDVNKDLFIPRIDQYYYKIFILALRLLQKDPYLAI